MAFCRTCGNQVNDNDTFCNRCGANLQSTTFGQSYPINNNVNYSNFNAAQVKRFNTFAIISIICPAIMLFLSLFEYSLIMILGVVGIVLAIIAMVKKNANASNFQNRALPIISIILCVSLMGYAAYRMEQLSNLFK